MLALSFNRRDYFRTLALVGFSTALFSFPGWAAILTEEKFNTHLRWNLFVGKEEVLVSKTGLGFYIETRNLPLFEKIKKGLRSIKIGKDYLGKMTFNQSRFPRRAAQARVDLKDESVELFSFYRKKEKKYVLDFWKSKSPESPKNSKGNRVKAVTPSGDGINARKLSPLQATQRKPKTKGAKKNIQVVIKNIKKMDRSSSLVDPAGEKYRDFRYGAAMIWDYPPLAPKLEAKIDISRKTPAYLYPIKDRSLEGGAKGKEPHMQLSINLYRKQKFGLMSKSIGLYERKYSVDKNYDLNQLLKALALIRENINYRDQAPFKSALVILDNIALRSEDYELKRAIFFYRIQYLMEREDILESLKLGKKLYVESREQRDEETARYAAQVILHTLSGLKQGVKVEQFCAEKSVQKLMAPQVLLAYRLLAHHRENKTARVIDLFEQHQGQLQAPIAASILYNAGESYFREGEYLKAIAVYQTFLQHYSHRSESSWVLVRRALAHELLAGDFELVVKLYEKAINLATNFAASYEAKIRYVAMRNTRKLKPDASDKKVLSFLELSPESKAVIDHDLKRLLWLVRLRIFLAGGEYRKALSYITSLPLERFTPVLRRMFEGDGAEIIYGMISDAFGQGNPSRVVKLWEIYRDIYESKVARDPYLNFMAAQSYISLGLEDSVQRTVDNLQRVEQSSLRTFPLWVSRVEYGGVKNLLAEVNILRILRQKDWHQVVKDIDGFNISENKKLFYETIALYHLKYFTQAIQTGEEFLRKTSVILPLNKPEIGQFFGAYLDSLYNISAQDKFKQATIAVLKDLEKLHVPLRGELKNLSEKFSYLLIESFAASANNGDHLLLEGNVKKFLTLHAESIYADRVKFLLASNFITLEKKPAGMKILNELVAGENTPDYIRAMSRSEIAKLKLDEKIIN